MQFGGQLRRSFDNYIGVIGPLRRGFANWPELLLRMAIDTLVQRVPISNS